MIKKDDLLALPRAVKPAKAMRAAQEHARPCTAPGVICAKVHETADGPVLALDLWARGGLYAREFFDGQGKVPPDKKTSWGKRERYSFGYAVFLILALMK